MGGVSRSVARRCDVPGKNMQEQTVRLGRVSGMERATQERKGELHENVDNEVDRRRARPGSH